MTIKPEVMAAIEHGDNVCELSCVYLTNDDWQTIRAELLAMDAENVRHVKMLADCFRMAGADPDGNEDWRIAPDALRAVTELRRDYDEACDAMHNSAREVGE